MNVEYWQCPICRFSAANEEEKIDHMRKMVNDPEHKITTKDELEEEIIEI